MLKVATAEQWGKDGPLNKLNLLEQLYILVMVGFMCQVG